MREKKRWRGEMKRSTDDIIEKISSSLSYGEILAGEQLAKISATLVNARVERKMTQMEFASFMGVSQGMVSKWESKDYNFTVETLALICEKLDLDLDIELKTQRRNGFFNKKSNLIPWRTSDNSVLTNHDEMSKVVA